MMRMMLKSKLHRVRLTGTELHYEGSITIDAALLEAADMLPGEQVHVLNLNNGSRIVTYTIEAPRGSGTIVLNGPAARMGHVGDEVIVISYGELDDEQAREHRPRTVFVDEKNGLITGS
jgi:aspartate 1-decarboxylase